MGRGERGRFGGRLRAADYGKNLDRLGGRQFGNGQDRAGRGAQAQQGGKGAAGARLDVIAAELVGAGMGMSIATAADPNTGAHSPALGQYYSVVLTLVFLALGGHLLFIDLVLKSYDTFPPGQTWLGAGRMEMVTDYASTMLLTALAIALPVTVILLLVQFAAGMLSRSAPSLNLFSLGLPAGVLAGIAGLIISAPMLPDTMSALTADALAKAGEVVTR